MHIILACLQIIRHIQCTSRIPSEDKQHKHKLVIPWWVQGIISARNVIDCIADLPTVGRGSADPGCAATSLAQPHMPTALWLHHSLAAHSGNCTPAKLELVYLSSHSVIIKQTQETAWTHSWRQACIEITCRFAGRHCKPHWQCK